MYDMYNLFCRLSFIQEGKISYTGFPLLVVTILYRGCKIVTTTFCRGCRAYILWIVHTFFKEAWDDWDIGTIFCGIVSWFFCMFFACLKFYFTFFDGG